MSIIDDYRKGWALRYIREAKDELEISQKASKPLNLIVDAARKAQAAIYYSLGDPSCIENVVNEIYEEANLITNPVLRCLVEIERNLQKLERLPTSASEEARKEAYEITWVASEIVDLLTCED